MTRKRSFEITPTTPTPVSGSSADRDSHMAHAHKLGSEAIVALFASAFQRIDRPVRALMMGLARWHEQRQTRDALMRCSDRVLADVGIEREHIPLVARGIDPAQYQLRGPALRRWWAVARAWPKAARALRAERKRLYRELDAYSDRELNEIGLRRADIAAIAGGQPGFGPQHDHA